MEIGLLTAPFGGESLKEVVAFASANGFSALEVSSAPGGGHADPKAILKDKGKSVKALLGGSGVRISSYACYMNAVDADPARRRVVRKHLKDLVLACEATGVDVLCTMAGMPVPGKTKMQTIEQDAAPFFREFCPFAADHGVKIALENWYATNIQHLEHWARLFELVPDRNFGLNFDPSHLVHQQIDYLSAVDEFASRIFHTHAKDCEIRQHVLARIGNQEGGWWRYVIPGLGMISWGEYIARLRRVGFNGVLSIEHEDGALGREEGFLLGQRHLSLFT